MHRFFFGLLLFPLAASAAALPSAGGHFRITEEGKQLGEARFSVAPISGGATLQSSGSMQLNKFSYSFRNATTVDAEANLVRDELTGSVHGAQTSADNIQFSTASDPTGRFFQIRVDADGKQTTNTVDRHRNLVLAPDLDPAAYTLMAHFALAEPQTAWMLIPKQNGILVPAEYTRVAELTGTLEGRSIPVEHSVVALGGENALVIELFYTLEGTLLEADLNTQNLRVVRDGFELKNHPMPVAPPRGQAPSPQNAQEPALGAPQ